MVEGMDAEAEMERRGEDSEGEGEPPSSPRRTQRQRHIVMP